MIINNFLSNRKSVREYRKKALFPETLDKIQTIVDNLVEGEGIEHIDLKLYENGDFISQKLEGKAGYGGVMINSPHYIALDLKDREEKTVIEAGYYMEKLVTEIVNLDLGTCWIKLGDVTEELKKETFGNDIDNIDYILAFGMKKRKLSFNKEAYSVKKGVEELVYDREINNFFSVEELENKGLIDIFYHIRFAPSTRNLQPCRFLIKDGKVELLLRYSSWYDSILIDGGIVMYYFEQLAHYAGIDNRWELLEASDRDVEGYTYRSIAEFKL